MQASIIVVLALATTVYCQGYGYNFGIPNGISQPNPNILSQYIVGRPKVYSYNTPPAFPPAIGGYNVGGPQYPGPNNYYPQIFGGGSSDAVPVLRFGPPQPQRETLPFRSVIRIVKNIPRGPLPF
ncbi:hypothetical protein PPYR_13452 [Photinus pyralis]|uniref:Uncharacterized protein n=1 Tax=Photinus pyralis TaxID=7054 RepID=A0A1Y1M6X2_PHOPY|nr:uncharacterized protein LOC116177726 [Photinus pyralis]KAB0793832.1 hypothetical protein PPYR_13452 [Photinus pyralis]